MLSVEIVYSPINAPMIHLKMHVSEGASVSEVLMQSGLFIKHPEAQALPVGVFSKKVTYQTLVKAGDRLEIYRPLQISPMEKRRELARKAR